MEGEPKRPVLLTSARVLLALAVLVLALSTGGCESPKPDAKQDPKPDDAARASLRTRFLKEYKLDGRVVFIEFGMIGCSLSEAGLNKMTEMRKDIGDEIPDLALVRVEYERDRGTADQYYANKSPGFTVHYDPDDSVSKAFDATVYPTFVLVDRFGRVRYRGPFPEQAELEDWVDTLLAEKTDPGPDAAMFGVSSVAVQTLLDETKLPDLKATVKPLREYMGKAGLLAVFVDTNCPFSGEAIGDMSKVAGTLTKHQVTSLLVNIADPKDTVLAFYAKRNTGTPILYDVTANTQKKWKVMGVPTVFLFDADGNVAYRGKAIWRDLAAAVEGALKLSAGTVNFGVKGTEYG